MLSQGVEPDDFPARCEAACRGGASGMLAGRALWTAALAADDPTELVRTQSVPRLQELGAHRRRARAALAREGVRIRGVIEGFYGPPWSHAERLDLIAFCGAHGLNTWVHAPKDDPFHRERWRDPYPDAEAGAACRARRRRARARRRVRLGDRARACRSTTRATAELETLVAKCRRLRELGAERVELLWDDVEHDLPQPGDLERYGDAERPSGAAQADLSNRFLAAFPQDGAARRVPDGLRRNRRDAVPAIVRRRARPVDPRLLDRARGRLARRSAATSSTPPSTRFGHELVLWDNYPVNDFDRERLFLGPLRGRDPGLDEGMLAGIVANGMLQAVPSKLPLATVADWARDPAAYDPLASFERALRAYGAEVVEALARLDRARSDRPAAESRRARRGPGAGRRRCHSARAPRAVRMTDVAVYGATASGVMAAAAAHAAGADVVLVDPGAHVGGMVSGGLSWTDVGDAACDRRPRAPLLRRRGRALRRRALGGEGPGAARRGTAARRRCSTASTCASERTNAPHAAVYVDASYEGDLMAQFGVPYAVGRESRDLYGETWAGRQPATRPGKHNFGVLLSPFADDGSLLPFIREPELDERGWPSERPARATAGCRPTGSASASTDRAENRLPLDAPAGLRPGAEFELLAALPPRVAGLDARDLLGLVPDLLPNGKCDVNSIGPFSLNLLDGSNRGYPDGSPDERAAIRAAPSPLRAGAAPLPRARRRRAGAHPRRGRALGALRRRVRRHGRLAAPAVRPRRPADARRRTCCASPTSSTRATARRRRARLVQHRHPRGRAHLALPARVRARARGLQRGLPLGRRPAVPDPVSLARAPPRGLHESARARCASPHRTSRSARCGWSRR